MKNIASFLDDYNKFYQIITEYSQSYRFCLDRMATKENNDRTRLLSKLQSIEATDVQNKARLHQLVQEQLSNMRRILQSVDSKEREITERRYKKFRADNTASNALNDEEIHHSQQDINRQVTATIQSIEKITKSKMPKSIAAVCGFFNRNFRKDAYRKIVENRQELEAILLAVERDLEAASAELKREIEQSTATEVSALSTELKRLDDARNAEKNAFLKQLKNLLLNGLERIFCSDTIYKKAHDCLAGYLSAYTGSSNQNFGQANELLLGIVNQSVAVDDDGTLDNFLSSILKDGLYSNSSILLPISLERYFENAICVNYYSEYNDTVYPIFGNLAIQMMNLFSDVGITTYLVDCTNMGSKYSDFTSFENIDTNKRINIIRTVDDFKKVIEELSDYIIETNTAYLKSDFQNICEYNNTSAIKREIKAVFISNISEITSVEQLEKLVSIIRNGNRCGVMTFVGVSSDECQVSGLTSQARVSSITALMELCDKISLSSTGELSFGNGLPQFGVAPSIKDSLAQNIMMSAIKNKGAMSIVPLVDKLLPPNNYFTQSCDENIVIPIGIDAQGNEYSLNLNKEAAYMLIGGNPSCGKSSLVHTIILQCITRYSPEQLELYVADLKDGSEFDVYVQKGISSVKVVLDDDEKDIATSFLNYIKANVELRLQKFSELSEMSGEIVKNIEQFYIVNNSQHLIPNIPRMLLIVDEFQSLFDSSRTTGEITNWLVRMCRTVGIYIIMASQRVQADASAVSNSFGSQTKEYFIYRAMFKLPYSGAKEIMSEQCSDTNRENPAIRRAQTLKSGQIIINPNMGSTEEDNQLIQCYYPNNDTISAVCDLVVSKQGKASGIIMNSESPTLYKADLLDLNTVALGESNRLYHDDCNKNNDEFVDNNIVSLRSTVNRLLVCGTDARIFASVFYSLIAKFNKDYKSNVKINILSSGTALEKMGLDSSLYSHINITQSVCEFLEFSQEQHKKGCFVLSVIHNPYEYDELYKADYSSATETVETMMNQLKNETMFSLVLCETISKLKNCCSYFDAEIPCRIISVGNLSSIRGAMTMDAGEKLSESPFNTIRPNVIKAYYYNKSTDKMGRVRLYQAEQIKRYIDFSSASAPANEQPVGGYCGLTGN